MDSERSGEATMTEPKGRGIASAPAAVVVTHKATKQQPQGGWKKGIAIFDFVLRLCAIATGLAATATMGTTEQTLPFFTQFFQFHAEYNDLPTFMLLIKSVTVHLNRSLI